jgi:succinyl-CoA synthetase beta subunit
LGAQILRDSGLQLIPAEGLADAAQKIVDAVKA